MSKNFKIKIVKKCFFDQTGKLKFLQNSIIELVGKIKKKNNCDEAKNIKL